MNLLDSGIVNNRIKVRSVILALVIHVSLAILTLGISLVLLLIIALITNYLIQKEIGKSTSASNTFKKNFPFRYYGNNIGKFQHVFFHTELIEKNIYEIIESKLKQQMSIDNLKAITISDIDKDLSKSEDRIFIKASIPHTMRGTSITLVFNQENFGKMQSIEWRVLVGGFIDHNKKFNLIAYSLFTFLFWIFPYIRKEYDLLEKVRTIYSSSYNDMDVITQVKYIHNIIFNAVIEELEKNNIDTSELKTQKMEAININISGGKVSIGNIVQGAMNKVSNIAGGKK